jgi:hypothetical protein
MTMKTISCMFLMLLAACDSKTESEGAQQVRRDTQAVESVIHSYCSGLRRAYQGAPVNTDSLVNAHFDQNVYYVTYWGTTEPIDTTKSRLKRALPMLKGYENRVEVVRTKVYGDVAVVFFILRQSYTLNGNPMDEYLPTTYVLERREDGWKVVHAHRSADLETTSRFVEIARNQAK